MTQPTLQRQPFLPVLIDNSPEREFEDIQPGSERPPEDVPAGEEPGLADEERADGDAA